MADKDVWSLPPQHFNAVRVSNVNNVVLVVYERSSYYCGFQFTGREQYAVEPRELKKDLTTTNYSS